jgi:hypothetical protein
VIAHRVEGSRPRPRAAMSVDCARESGKHWRTVLPFAVYLFGGREWSRSRAHPLGSGRSVCSGVLVRVPSAGDEILAYGFHVRCGRPLRAEGCRPSRSPARQSDLRMGGSSNRRRDTIVLSPAAVRALTGRGYPLS